MSRQSYLLKKEDRIDKLKRSVGIEDPERADAEMVDRQVSKTCALKEA